MSSSLQQPAARKRPRCESNNTSSISSSEITAKSNTNINLLSLPDEALDNIISYSIPRTDYQYMVWKGIGVLSQTCRTFRRFAQTYAPTRIVLKDFVHYYTYPRDGCVDYRLGFLQSLRDFSWKRQHLKEFHVDPISVLRVVKQEDGRVMPGEECSNIKALLRILITTPSSFPELEWLDIELQSDNVSNYDLINAEALRLMPDALPALDKLCLSYCLTYSVLEINTHRFRQFFTKMQTPLSSLSICGAFWMSDAHVEAMIPIVGENLVRLELVDCEDYDEATEEAEKLSDSSLVCIAQHCKQLKSFSMVSSHITSRGLEAVLSANTGITTLNLSDSIRLDPRAVDIISRYLPRLEVLRNYWPSLYEPDWLNDNGLIALVDAQENESGGSGIFLKLIGFFNYKFEHDGPQLTIRGIKYAIEKGVDEIEIDNSNLYKSIVHLGSDVKLYWPEYVHYVDGSLYERERATDSSYMTV